MAGQDLTVELFYDGVWNDLTADEQVFATPITITQGLADESTALRPASVTAQLDNRTDLFRPTNPISPLYGRVGRNTPLRVKIDDAVRANVELSSLTTDQTQDFRQIPARGRAWADVQAGGILQRINQWSKPIRSPMYRYLSRLTTTVGYWPLEDGPGAKTLYSPTPGASTDILRGCEFQSQSRPAGSGPVLVLPNNANTLAGVRFAPATGSDTDGYQLVYAVNFGSVGESGDIITFLTWETDDGKSFSLTWVDGTDLLILGNEADGTVLINTTLPGFATDTDWNRWNLLLIAGFYSGGTTDVTVGWLTEGDDFITSGGGGSYSGVPSTLSRAFLYAGAALGDIDVGHLIGLEGFTEDLSTTTMINVFNGHRGDLAAARFARLCEEEGIPYYVRSEWASSYPMGPQSVDTLAALFKEIVATDDGLIFDVRDERRLLYVGRADRYRRPVALTLTPEDFPALPKETFDDKGLWNIATASQRDGGEYEARDDTGPLGTQDPPDGAGEKRQQFDVSVADESTGLVQTANWWLKRGTVDLPRFPKLTLNLATLPELVSTIDGLQVGDVIEIVGFRENTIRVHIIGWTEVIRPVDGGKVQRMITFNCAPDQQFVVGEIDAADFRPDLGSCTLDGVHSPSATSLALQMTEDESWSTTGVPYDLYVAGERVTVTAMGARTGTGPWAQTATVIRSVNGIVKQLPDEAEVHVVDQGRVGL